MNSKMTLATEAGTVVLMFKGRIEFPKDGNALELRRQLCQTIDRLVDERYSIRPSNMEVSFSSPEDIELGNRHFWFFKVDCYVQFNRWGEEFIL